MEFNYLSHPRKFHTNFFLVSNLSFSTHHPPSKPLLPISRINSSWNPSCMSRLFVNRQTREQRNVSPLNSVKSGLLAKAQESTTFLMPKPNICNWHCAMCGSCIDDDIHSQLLFGNNSKLITYMRKIVSKYWTADWPKSQQVSNC